MERQQLTEILNKNPGVAQLAKNLIEPAVGIQGTLGLMSDDIYWPDILEQHWNSLTTEQQAQILAAAEQNS